MIWPLDQGIISSFKANYRYQLIKAIVEKDSSVPGFLKPLNIKDAMYLCEDPWRAMKPYYMHNCWNEALGNADEAPEATEENLISLVSQKKM